MKCIVCDTGPLLHLEEARVRDLLARAGEVHAPAVVEAEMRRHEVAWPDRKPSWLRITSLNPSYELEAQDWHQAGLLDAGEAHAIALARQLEAKWFLTDDAAARLIGHSLGLEVHGSLGIVLWAAAMNYLTRGDCKAALDRLARSSLWVSASVLLAAKTALHRICS